MGVGGGRGRETVAKWERKGDGGWRGKGKGDSGQVGEGRGVSLRGEKGEDAMANKEKKGKCLASWPLVLADHQTQTKQDDQDEQHSRQERRQEALQLYASRSEASQQAQEADYLARVWRLGLSCFCRGGRQLRATATAFALEHRALATAAGRGLGEACGGGYVSL